MLIGLLGDLHGRVFRALAVLDRWQRERNQTLDLIIQVGDVGVFPDPTHLDAATRRFAEEDPAELGFSKLLAAQGEAADSIRSLRQRFTRPIYVICGNHDDIAWLRLRHAAHAPIDPFDLFHYVSDGTVIRIGDVTIAFLGGVETEEDQPDDLLTRVAATGSSRSQTGATVDEFARDVELSGVSRRLFDHV